MMLELRFVDLGEQGAGLDVFGNGQRRVGSGWKRPQNWDRRRSASRRRFLQTCCSASGQGRPKAGRWSMLGVHPTDGCFWSRCSRLRTGLYRRLSPPRADLSTGTKHQMLFTRARPARQAISPRRPTRRLGPPAHRPGPAKGSWRLLRDPVQWPPSAACHPCGHSRVRQQYWLPFMPDRRSCRAVQPSSAATTRRPPATTADTDLHPARCLPSRGDLAQSGRRRRPAPIRQRRGRLRAGQSLGPGMDRRCLRGTPAKQKYSPQRRRGSAAKQMSQLPTQLTLQRHGLPRA